MNAENTAGGAINYIETISGKLLNPLDPKPEDISLQDIAWGLSRMSRFAGHTITEIPYNVAQHSIYVSELFTKWLYKEINIPDGDQFREIFVDEEDMFIKKALLHDGHEAYTGDIPSPLKRIKTLNETLKSIERSIDTAIDERFSLRQLTDQEKQILKYFDKLAQRIEAYQYMPSRGKNWVGLPEPTLVLLQQFPTPKPALESYNLFIDRFERLDK